MILTSPSIYAPWTSQRSVRVLTETTFLVPHYIGAEKKPSMEIVESPDYIFLYILPTVYWVPLIYSIQSNNNISSIAFLRYKDFTEVTI